MLVLGACAGGKSVEEAENKPDPDSVEVLYNKAANALDEGNSREAIQLFEEVERLHPYSQWSNKAQLMSGYAAYSDRNYDEAILALDRFTELHPGHENVDYAHYLKALSFYEQISDVARDQQMTELALDSFETLIRRFPDSQYVRDATLKRDLTLDKRPPIRPRLCTVWSRRI